MRGEDNQVDPQIDEAQPSGKTGQHLPKNLSPEKLYKDLVFQKVRLITPEEFELQIRKMLVEIREEKRQPQIIKSAAM